VRNENDRRDSFGVIATLVNTETRECDSFVVPGLVLAAIRVVCDECDLRGNEWRIRSLSTPRTILADLIGRTATPRNGLQRFPEGNLLGRIGRKDLLAPELEEIGAKG
jgi:hypothetical protein